MERRNESFGRLLKAGTAAIAYIEGKTQPAVEADLGALIGVAGATLQRYKAGHLPPDPESIEILAEACVKRGLMGRAWLERFVETAHLSSANARACLGRLFPDLPRSRAPVVQPNLPPPTYSRFVMRQHAYAALMDGLHSRLPVTLLISLGGMGKTSLAHAIAEACLHIQAAEPSFQAVVWVSDKDSPGTTNLSTVLNQIARVLDYPGLLARSFVERQREIEVLLRRQAVLLVVDNAETITDQALLDWLLQIPHPSRALVTSRFQLFHHDQVYLVELEPMSRAEVHALISAWLPRSKLRHVADALEHCMAIADLVGGNPKALELALGLLQHQSWEQVVALLKHAQHELFDELFTCAWNTLDRTSQHIIASITLFPVHVSAAALAYCVDLPVSVLERCMQHLVSLSLADSTRIDLHAEPRYSAHPLVRAYVQARFGTASPEYMHLRERWMHWCIETATAVGFCWNDLPRLEMLDADHQTIQAAITWAAAHERHAEVLVLVEGIRYYYNVRGIWGEEQLANHERRAASARALGEPDQAILALAHLAETLSKQGRLDAAAQVMEQLIAQGERTFEAYIEAQQSMPVAASPDVWTFHDDAMFEYGHALALYARAHEKTAEAERVWRQLLMPTARVGGQKYVVTRRWLATMLFQQGNSAAARELFLAALNDAQTINDLRSVSGNVLKLAHIDLLEGNVHTAEDRLQQCRDIAARYHDRRRLAEYHMLIAKVATLRGDTQAATSDLLIALDLFERLGMQREAADARTILQELHHQGASIHAINQE
jgi:tetratricopeptide (TPR) repeat protein